MDHPVEELMSELVHLYDVVREEAPGGSTANEEEAPGGSTANEEEASCRML